MFIPLLPPGVAGLSTVYSGGDWLAVTEDAGRRNSWGALEVAEGSNMGAGWNKLLTGKSQEQYVLRVAVFVVVGLIGLKWLLD